MFAFTAIACAPTYPAASFTQSIEKLCQSEYGLTVQAWWVGKTVGLDVPMEALFTSTTALEEGASQRLEEAIQGLSRVILSTDADPDFLLVRSYEEAQGDELVLIRNIPDMKKAYGMQISRGEYLERSVLQRRVNPVIVGEQAVRDLLTELQRGRVSTALASYFRGDISRSLSPPFFLYLLELERKQEIYYDNLLLESVRVSGEVGLIHVRFQETYQLKEGIKSTDLVYPSGFEHEWLFEVVGTFPPKVIHSATALTLWDPNGHVVRAPFPVAYTPWSDVENWKNQPFQEDVGLDMFVTEQTNRRLQIMLTEPKLAQYYAANGVLCYFEPDAQPGKSGPGQVFHIDVTGRRLEDLPEGKEDPVLKAIIKLANVVLDGYDYTDCHLLNIKLTGENPYLITR